MEKLPMGADTDPETLWDEECEDLRSDPLMQAGSQAYQDMRAEILTPDLSLATQPPR